MKITSLPQDIQATNACNEFRKRYGMAKAKNPYPYWKYMMAVISINPKGVTISESLKYLEEIGVTNISHTVSGIFTKIARGEQPNPIVRDFGQKIPGYVDMLKLELMDNQQITGSRPANIFKFKNCKIAREIIINRFPEMTMLIKLLLEEKRLKIIGEINKKIKWLNNPFVLKYNSASYINDETTICKAILKYLNKFNETNIIERCDELLTL